MIDILELVAWSVSVAFLPEHDYVTFRYLLSQIRLSVVYNIIVPYSAR